MKPLLSPSFPCKTKSLLADNFKVSPFFLVEYSYEVRLNSIAETNEHLNIFVQDAACTRKLSMELESLCNFIDAERDHTFTGNRKTNGQRTQ